MGEWPHKLTEADKAKGRRNRWAMITPEMRKRQMTINALRRWYKTTWDDMERVDGHLNLLARQVAESLYEQDRRGVVIGVSAMVPLERIKIALKQSGMRDVTPGTPVEGQSEIESKLQQASERRRKAFTDNDHDEAVETTSTKLPTE